jgi:hypothetical protein
VVLICCVFKNKYFTEFQFIIKAKIFGKKFGDQQVKNIKSIGGK